MRRATGVLLVWLIAVVPAAAGQSAGGMDFSMPGSMPPAESGKPVLPPPSSLRSLNRREDCPPALPCGTRLLGTIRKDGALELNVPALRW